MSCSGVLQCSKLAAEDESIHCDKPGLKLAEAQKLYKYASANDMTNEGIPSAIDHLEKALRFLQLGNLWHNVSISEIFTIFNLLLFDIVRKSQADDCNYGVWKPERCVMRLLNGKGESEEAKTKVSSLFY